MRPIIAFGVGLLASAASLAQDPTQEPEKYFPQQMTAKDLSLYCASSSMTDRGRQRQKYCSGFVSGVEEAVRLLAKQSASSQFSKICLPQGKNGRQFTDVYVKYAVRKATDLKKPAALVVIEALKKEFPCTD